jgi:hypothetical protein
VASDEREAAHAWTDSAPAVCGARDFRVIDGGEQYALELRDVPITFELRQVRYERGDLFGRLTVRTALHGTRSFAGVLGAPSTLNLSSAQARSTRAKLLTELSRAPQIDWHRLIEELAVRVFEHQDQGEPAVDLASLPDPGDVSDDTFNFLGIILPSQHQSILFGDGAVMKSYLELAIAAHMAASGLRVALFDWEMKANDHKRRLIRLYGAQHPSVLHKRCDRPLVHECESLRRFVRRERIDYAFYDSAGYATQGDPSSAESALAYFQATSLIGVGGCHLAHITKAGDQSDQKPFGSAFWHNSARCTWNVKLEIDDRIPQRQQKVLGLFNRKNSFDDLYNPVGLSVTFPEARTAFAPTDLKETENLVRGIPLHRRITALIKDGGGAARTYNEIAEELSVHVDSVIKAVKRHPGTFARITKGTEDGVHRVGLVERRGAA